MQSSAITGLFTIGLITGLAAASGFGVTAQERRVDSTALLENFDGASVDDPDIDESFLGGLFNENASSYIEQPVGLASGGASQDSIILPNGLDAIGSSFCNAETYDFDYLAFAEGESRITIDFILHFESEFTAAGFITASDFGTTFIELCDADTLWYDAFVTGPFEELTLNDSLTLPPGVYTLEISARSGAWADIQLFGYGFAEYNLALRFEAGCRAVGDVDGDGVVGPADLAALLGSWGAPACGDNTAPCPVDLDKDGAVGSGDLGALLGSWGACD
ncbi:MAG: hypothetical protein VYC34_07085 [Planctomycetota bacterium]|nr:hypothetical protein [Planctomycetota bacterium]